MDRSWLYEGVAKNENVDTSDPNWTHNIYGVSTWSDWMNEYNEDPENPSVYPDYENPIINADGSSYARVRFTDPDTAKAVGERIIDEHYENSQGDLVRFATTYINGYESDFDTLNPEFKSRTKNYSNRLSSWQNYGETKEVVKQTASQIKNREYMNLMRPTLEQFYKKETLDDAIERGISYQDFIYGNALSQEEQEKEKLANTPAYELDTFSTEYAKRMGSQFVAGFGDVAYSMGGGLDWLGFEVGEDLREWGESVQKSYGQQTDPDLFKGEKFLPDLFEAMTDGDFWLLDAPRLLPNILTLLIPYTAGAKATSLALRGTGALLSKVPKIAGFFDKVGKTTQATKLGQKVASASPVVAELIGGAYVGRQLESLMEAGGLYNELKQEGYSDQEASLGAKEVHSNNMNMFWLDIPQLALAFGKMPTFLKADVAKWYTTMGVKTLKYTGAGVSEGAEEITQSYFTDLGRAFAIDKDKYQDMSYLEYLSKASTNPEAKKSFALGFLSGTAFQGMGDLGQKLFGNEDADITTAEAKEIIDQLVEDYADINEVRGREKVDIESLVESRLKEITELNAFADLGVEFTFSNREMMDEVTQDQVQYNLEELEKSGNAEKTGEVIDGQPVYRIKGIRGANDIKDGTVRFPISKRATKEDVAEEVIEAVVKALTKSNPALALEIERWINENTDQSNDVSGLELFAKAFLYGNSEANPRGNAINKSMSGILVESELADAFSKEFDGENGNVITNLLEGDINFEPKTIENPTPKPEQVEVQEDVNDEVEVTDENTGAVITEADADVIAERVKGTKYELFEKQASPEVKERVKEVLRKIREQNQIDDDVDLPPAVEEVGEDLSTLSKKELENKRKSELSDFLKSKGEKALVRDTKKVLIERIRNLNKQEESTPVEEKSEPKKVEPPKKEPMPDVLTNIYANPQYTKTQLAKIAKKEGIDVLKTDTKAKIIAKIEQKFKPKKKMSAKTMKKEVVKAIQKKKPVSKPKPKKKDSKSQKIAILSKRGDKPLTRKNIIDIFSKDPQRTDVELVENSVDAQVVRDLLKELGINPSSPPYSLNQSSTTRSGLTALHMYYRNKQNEGLLNVGQSFSIAVMPDRPIPPTYEQMDGLQKSILQRAVASIRDGARIIFNIDSSDPDSRDNLIDIVTEQTNYVSRDDLNESLGDEETIVFENVKRRADRVEFFDEEVGRFPDDFETKEYEIGDGYRALDYYVDKASYSVADREAPKLKFSGDASTLSDEDLDRQIKGKKTKIEKENIKNQEENFGQRKFFSDKLRTFSRNLAKIHPTLPTVFKKYQFESRKYYNEAMEDFKPLIKKLKEIKKLGKGGWVSKGDKEVARDYIDIELGLKNSDFDNPKFQALIKKYDLKDAIDLARLRFEKFARDFKAVGMDIGYINNYIARTVSDYTNLLAYLEKNGKISQEERIQIQQVSEQMGQEGNGLLRDDQILQIVQDIIVGNGATNKNGSIDNGKARKILEINAEMNAYYRDTFDALNIYANQVSEKIMQKRFLGGSHYGIRKKKGKNGKTYYIITNRVTNQQIKSEQFLSKARARARITALEKQDAEKQGAPHFDMSVQLDSMVEELIKKYDLDVRNADRLKQLLNVYFTKGKGDPFWSGFKTLGYIGTLMSGLFSTITQFADISLAIWRSGDTGLARIPTGLVRTSQALAKSFIHGVKPDKALFKNGFIAKEDYGIDSIAEEYLADDGHLVNVFRLLSKNLFFEFTDALGKNTTVNATLYKYRSAIRRPDSKTFAELDFKLDTMGYNQGEKQRIYNALSSNNFTDPIVKEFAYYELLNVQPIDKSEVPPYYLENPGFGRLWYQLKTFMIKRWDVFYDDTLMIRDKATKFQEQGQTAKAYAGYAEMMFRMTMLATTLALGESGVDRFKDWVAGRRSTPMTDLVASNVMKIFGLSKYNYFQFQREGLLHAMVKLILPASFSMADDIVIQDLGFKFLGTYAEEGVKTIGREASFGKAMERGTKRIAQDIKKDGIRSWKYIPMLGKHLYWWDTETMGRKPKGLLDKADMRVINDYVIKIGGGMGARRTKKYDRQPKGEIGKARERVERKLKRTLNDLVN